MSVLSDFRAASSVLMDRFRFAGMQGITFGGMRDLYQILGYRRVLTYFDYRDRYARGGIAKAIVDAYPSATWRGGVEVFEDKDPKTDTEFEKAFKELDGRLGIWPTLQQADVLTGLSTFSVLLIGTADGKVAEELPRGGEIKFLKTFSGGGGSNLMRRSASTNTFEAAARVQAYDVDPTSERFGEPLVYSIRTTNGEIGYSLVNVHWSRVIHFAEGCLEDNVFGIPTLESVWNLLDDLDKITGGGAEAHWLRANQGLHLDVDKDMGLPGPGGVTARSQGLSPSERTDLRDKAEEMQHQLQRVLVTRGVTATQLGSDVASFGNNADAVLKQIAGAAKIPMRILTGSEMGTLASEQDAANFDSRVQDRRTGYAGPKMIRRLIDRLITYDYLPTPKQYIVGWPVEENMDEKGKADFALALANVNKTYGEPVFTDDEIRDMAFDKEPLPDVEDYQNLTELDKASVAKTLALVNKEQGITVFTDDEIRKMAFGLEPLTDAQKIPIAAPIRENAVAGNNPDATLKAPPALPPAPLAQPLAQQLKALEAAIESDDLAEVGRILGLNDDLDLGIATPQTFEIAKGLSRDEAMAEAKRLTGSDFRGVTYDAETGVLKVLNAR